MHYLAEPHPICIYLFMDQKPNDQNALCQPNFVRVDCSQMNSKLLQPPNSIILHQNTSLKFYLFFNFNQEATKNSPFDQDIFKPNN